MIRQVTSSLKCFKSLRFRNGLNLIVADKSEGATGKQTRNSSGKSSLLEIFHFLLGGNCDADSIFRRDTLINESFSLSFDLGKTKLTATRSGCSKSRVYVDTNIDSWPIQPTLDKDGYTSFSNDMEWRRMLGEEMFSIRESDESHTPSFRSMISYFIRREGAGGFQKSTLQSTAQVNWDEQINLSYLLDLDWRIPHDLQQIRIKEKSLTTLKRDAKSGLMGKIVGKVGELRSRLTVAERQLAVMTNELNNFKVLPEYESLEQEASRLAIAISAFSTQNELDHQRIVSVEQQLREEGSGDQIEVESMYAEANIVLPDFVKKQLDDVILFNRAILNNRRSHLQGEVDSANQRIQTRRSEMEFKDRRRIEILEALSSHGALDQLNRLRVELARKQADVNDLRKRLDVARLVETQDNDLKIERVRVKQRLDRDLEDRQSNMRDAIVMFEDFSKQISDHEGTLIVESSDNGPVFDISVEGERSKGIRNMQTFCLDLMLSVLWIKTGLGPGFLVHDSHLFDGMDSRQVANAIELGESQSRLHRFQYIVTINSDQLSGAEFSSSFKAKDYINDIRLSDESDTGGLFGMRI